MKTTIAVVIALIFLIPPSSGGQSSLPEWLRKGIVEEDVNHNPEAAIANYRRAVAEYDAARQTAATALFRLAECYRKQGKKRESEAAYLRVVNEFADQARLVEASRRQLGTGAPEPAKPDPVTREATEARRRYRKALQDKVDLAERREAEFTRQMELGTRHPSDGADAQLDLLRAKRRLAMFDAGMSGPGAAEAARSPMAGQARSQIRTLFEHELDAARKALAVEEQKHQLGVGSTKAINRRKLAIVELEAESAAFDASTGRRTNNRSRRTPRRR